MFKSVAAAAILGIVSCHRLAVSDVSDVLGRNVDKYTHNIDVSLIEAAISPKTKAIMLAHSLGNPFNLDVVTRLCKKYNLWLIEDCCDALGAT